jgi:hypothetical protein
MPNFTHVGVTVSDLDLIQIHNALCHGILISKPVVHSLGVM